MSGLKGRVAVITGAGGGIGRATSVALAKEGVNMVLLGENNPERLAETERAVLETGAKCLPLGGDLTDMDFLDKSVKTAAEKMGGIDILINNAGIAYNSKFEDTPEAVFDKIMKINVKVPYFLTQKVLPYLRKSDRASIVNLSSVVGHSGYPLQSAYVASKHAVLGFTKSLAAELYTENIRVHAICPGGVYTDMVKVARPDLSPEGMIMPEEIADIVLFFLKNRGNAVVDEICVHRVNKQPFLV